MNHTHHLPYSCYRGEICVAITACVQPRRPIFINSDIVTTFVKILEDAVLRNSCVVPVYCFMPDHFHLMTKGLQETSDFWRAMLRFKQITGFWLSKHSSIRWQDNFYDHVLRRDEDFANQVRYIVNNPVRRGLVKNWQDYPFTGSIGFDLKELLFAG